MFGEISSGIVVICMGVLAYLLTRQYIRKRQTYTFWWAVAFWIALVAAMTDLASYIGHGWSPLQYKLYLLAAATLVAYMGAGTVYLFSRKIGRIYVIVMTLIALVMAVQLAGLALPGIHSFPSGEKAQGFVPPNLVIGLSFAVLSGIGALALFVGALYSYARSRRVYNLWIALGALVFSIGGTVGNAIGVYELFYLFQAIGAIVLYYGIVLSYRTPKSAGS